MLRARNRVADECDVIPRDSYSVLIAVTGLMEGSHAFLESVYLKHIKKVEPIRLPKLFKEMEVGLVYTVVICKECCKVSRVYISSLTDVAQIPQYEGGLVKC